MAYLEAYVPEDGYMFGALSIADITISAMLLNAMFAEWHIDKAQWPKMVRYIERVYAHPVVAKYNELANHLRTLPHKEHQKAVNDHISRAV